MGILQSKVDNLYGYGCKMLVCLAKWQCIFNLPTAYQYINFWVYNVGFSIVFTVNCLGAI